MVNLVEDWKVLQEYARDKQGYCQVLSNDGTVEIRESLGEKNMNPCSSSGSPGYVTYLV